MAQHYASFLVRCWRLSAEEERIKIEHIQSGDSTQVASLTDAVTWIEAHHATHPPQQYRSKEWTSTPTSTQQEGM
jgi:hypothetical protein